MAAQLAQDPLQLGTRRASRYGSAAYHGGGAARSATIYPTAPVDARDVEAPALLEEARAALERDGFVHLKGLIPAQAIAGARRRVLADLEARGGVLERSGDAALVPECGLACVPFLEGKNDVTHDPSVLSVLEAPALERFFERLFEGSVRTLDYKWLRGVPRGVATGAHLDRVYMGRGTSRMHTSWVPLGDAPLELGGLAMLAGSHKKEGGLARLHETYGALDTERDGLEGTGWFTSDPLEVTDRFAPAGECVWRASDYAAGDVVVFGLDLVHMSTANLTDDVRLSADVRWLPARDTVDPRYVGAASEAERPKAGAFVPDAPEIERVKKDAAGVSIEDLKRSWGFAVHDG